MNVDPDPGQELQNHEYHEVDPGCSWVSGSGSLKAKRAVYIFKSSMFSLRNWDLLLKLGSVNFS